MSTALKPAGDLIAFQKSVWDHLVDTGMDTIAYLPDPTDKTKVSNAVKSHSRYTVQSAQTLIQDQVELYDDKQTTRRRILTYLRCSLRCSETR